MPRASREARLASSAAACRMPPFRPGSIGRCAAVPPFARVDRAAFEVSPFGVSSASAIGTPVRDAEGKARSDVCVRSEGFAPDGSNAGCAASRAAEQRATAQPAGPRGARYRGNGGRTAVGAGFDEHPDWDTVYAVRVTSAQRNLEGLSLLEPGSPTMKSTRFSEPSAGERSPSKRCTSSYS